MTPFKGLSLLFDPDVLIQKGAKYLGHPDTRVIGFHHFVLVRAIQPGLVWTVLYSRYTKGRIRINAQKFRDWPERCGGFYHPRQQWVIPWDIAWWSYKRSWRDGRRRIDESALPDWDNLIV